MSRSSLIALALVALCAAAALPLAAAASGDGWKYGRATKYGNDGGSTVHEGSCMFGNLDANKGTGYDIAALSDTDPEYAGSCGRCYEVACVDADVVDGFGQTVGRRGSCYDSSNTVVVMITDTCPCHYPANWQSNKRWCCGDKPHMDLSYTAFKKLANEGLGVIAVRWRRVKCPAGSPTHPKCDHLPSCFNTGDNSDASLPSAGGSDAGSNSGNGGSWVWDDSSKQSKWVDFSSQNSNSNNDGSKGSSSGGGSWVWDDSSKQSKWVDFNSQNSNSNNGGKGSGSWVWDDSSKQSKWVDFSSQSSNSNNDGSKGSSSGGGSWVWDDSSKQSKWVDAASQQKASATHSEGSSGGSGGGGGGWWGWDSSSKQSKWMQGGGQSWGGWASRFGSRRRV